MRILIAEDDATSRAMVSAVLRHSGHEVLETVDGTQAWAEMQKPGAPKLAVIDWMMPEMDGLELVRRIRSMQSPPCQDDATPDTAEKPYLIMLTAKGERADIITGLDAGADDYVAKPFDAGELRARIEVGQRMLDLQEHLAAQVAELRQALDHIKTLQGILPICSFCKKIRDDRGYWSQVEEYISKHSRAAFSHGICPDCMKQHYAEFADDCDN